MHEMLLYKPQKKESTHRLIFLKELDCKSKTYIFFHECIVTYLHVIFKVFS